MPRSLLLAQLFSVCVGNGHSFRAASVVETILPLIILIILRAIRRWIQIVGLWCVSRTILPLAEAWITIFFVNILIETGRHFALVRNYSSGLLSFQRATQLWLRHPLANRFLENCEACFQLKADMSLGGRELNFCRPHKRIGLNERKCRLYFADQTSLKCPPPPKTNITGGEYPIFFSTWIDRKLPNISRLIALIFWAWNEEILFLLQKPKTRQMN